MRETLYQYLLARPSGATAAEILDLVFTQPGRDSEFGPRFLRTLLGNDPRFAYRAAEGRWLARAHEHAEIPLQGARFVVLDIETTGGPAAEGGITEIGAVRVCGGKIEAEFRQLINPRQTVQPFVVRLTGITDDMLAGQPYIEEVLPRFLEFAGDGVLVAHNASFDLGFLNAAMHRHFGRPLHQAHLCTIRLARRLVPAARRRSLDALAAHFGVTASNRHRALGDARIAAEILLCLLDCAAARGVARLDQLLDLQHHARDGRRFTCALPAERIDKLPERPGVYRFLGEDGRLLYVGRAKNLRRRVGSYAHNSASHRDRTLDLIRHIHAVHTVETGSELEAALLEAEMIRSEQPPYNRRSKHLPRVAYLKLTVGQAFPRLSIAGRPTGGRARFFGPFRGRESAGRFRDALLRLCRARTCRPRIEPDPRNAPCFLGQTEMCSAPCAARVDAGAYAAQIDRLTHILEGDIDWALEELGRRRDNHSAALRFEAAARAEQDRELIDRLARQIRKFAWLNGRPDAVVLLPGAPEAGGAQAFLVIGGKLAYRGTIRSEAELGGLRERVAAAWAELRRTPLRRNDIEAATILAAWFSSRDDRDGFVFQLTEPTPDLAEWRLALRSLLAAEPPAFDTRGDGGTGVQPPPDREHQQEHH